MKKHVGYRVLSTLMVLMFMAAAVAQAQPAGDHQPPKILVIFREWVKPGKADSVHEKSEAAYVHAMAQAKEPNALPGPQVPERQNPRTVHQPL